MDCIFLPVQTVIIKKMKLAISILQPPLKYVCISVLLFISSAVLSERAYAKTRCLKDTICIETVRDNSAVDFYVNNLKDFDVTITLIMNAQNLAPEGPFPYTETIQGKSEVKMFRLSVIDSELRSHYNYHVDWTRGSIYAEHDSSYLYRLPYQTGTSHRVSQGFYGGASHSDSDQHAVDFSMPDGTPVYASRGGIVVGIREHHDRGGPIKDFAHFANHVLIRHQDETIGEYHHLEKNGAAVKTGDRVRRGQLIGFSGNTGFSSNPHLHFGVYKSRDGKRRISLPVIFKSRRGIISSPIKGERYIAE